MFRLCKSDHIDPVWMKRYRLWVPDFDRKEYLVNLFSFVTTLLYNYYKRGQTMLISVKVCAMTDVGRKVFQTAGKEFEEGVDWDNARELFHELALLMKNYDIVWFTEATVYAEVRSIGFRENHQPKFTSEEQYRDEKNDEYEILKDDVDQITKGTMETNIDLVRQKNLMLEDMRRFTAKRSRM